MKHFMVRVLRSTGDDSADVVVKAETAFMAERIAVDIVEANPDEYFGPVDVEYYVDPSQDTEEVSSDEYAAANG